MFWSLARLMRTCWLLSVASEEAAIREYSAFKARIWQLRAEVFVLACSRSSVLKAWEEVVQTL